MDREAVLPCECGDAAHLLEGPDGAAAAVVRVLQREHALPGEMHVVAVPEHRLDGGLVEDARRAVDDQALRAPERGDGAALVVDDVAVALAGVLFPHAGGAART